MKPPRRSLRNAGFTLIDVLMVIVLLGIVAVALTSASGKLAAQSAEALKTRQTLTFAQGLLAEVMHMPFTYCDPNDNRAALATSATVGGAGCTAQVEALGPEPGESRYSAVARFDNVNDYQGFTMPGAGCAGGLCDQQGNLINATGPLAGCTAQVNMVAQALNGIAANDVNGRPQALRIIVTVACPGADTLIAEGIRVRHAPNSF